MKRTMGMKHLIGLTFTAWMLSHLACDEMTPAGFAQKSSTAQPSGNAADGGVLFAWGAQSSPKRFRGLESARLAAQLKSLEQESHRLVNLTKREKDARRITQLEDKIREVLTKAFELRQRIQQANVDRLRDRLEMVESSLKKRGRLKSKIIEKRLTDLLQKDADLQWEGNAIGAAPAGLPLGSPKADAYSSQISRSTTSRNTSTGAPRDSTPRSQTRASTRLSSGNPLLMDRTGSVLRSLVGAKGKLTKAKDRLQQVEKLFEKGYVTSQEVQAAKLEVDQATLELAIAEKEYETRIAQLNIDIREAKLVLEAALNELKQVEKLVYNKSIPRQQFDAKKLQVDRANLNLQRAENALNLYLQAKPQITAPMRSMRSSGK